MSGQLNLALPSGGSVTVAAPDSASDTTVTLPAGNCTLLSNKTAGTVLQVVQGSTQTQVQNFTTTYTDTGLTATITPTSANSKILVMVCQSTYRNTGSTSNSVNIKLFRDATDLGRKVYVQGYTGTAIELYSMASFTYLDSPATTAAVTYKTQFANQISSSVASVQPDNNGASTIILMEIAA